MLDNPGSFQLNDMLLSILEGERYRKIGTVHAARSERQEWIYFEHVKSENGEYKTIRCSDVELWYEER